MRVAEKIMGHLNERAELENVETIEEAIPLLESIASMFPAWVSMICPFNHPERRFISANCTSIFGLDAAYFKSHMTIENFFDLVHPDDAEDLHDCFAYLEKFLREQSPEEQQQVRVVFQYRIYAQNGQFVTLQDEKGVLRLPNNKNIHYTIFKDISRELIFSGVQLSVYRQAEGLIKIAEYKPTAENLKLSKREQDIVSLIRHGLTNKEIAYRLNISHNTSRNIRSRLFEKFRVNNVVELLNVAV